MNPFFALTKTQFNQTFGLSVLKQKYSKRISQVWKPVGFLLLMGLALMPFEIGLIGFFNQFYTLLETTNQEPVLLTMAVLGGQLMVLLFGLFYLLSTFYFSGDLKLLLPLPLRPRDIIGAKMAVVLASEYLTLLPFIAPIFIVYGIRCEAAWWYWPFALAVFLLLPVIPLAISLILIIPLMRFTALVKNRDLFRILGSLAGVAIFVIFQLTVNRSGPGADGQQLQQWLSSEKVLSGIGGTVFLPVNWAVAALSLPAPLGAMAKLLAFAAVSLVPLVPVLPMAGKWFFRGVTGGYEVRSSGRRSRVITDAAFKSHSPVPAFLLRELKVFFRTPVFVLNGLIGYIIIPVILFISLQSNTMEETLPDNFQIRLIIALVAAGVIILNNSLSSIASTAISREGKMFWISKHLPLSAREQVTAKLMHSMIFPIIGAILIALIPYFFFKLTAAYFFLIVVLGVLGSLPAAEIGLIIDLIRPNLDWTDPQRAIKGFNGLLGFLAGVLIFGALALAGVVLIHYGVQLTLVCLFFSVAFLVLGLFLYWILARLAEKRYPLL